MRGDPLERLGDLDSFRASRIRRVLLIEDNEEWAEEIAAALAPVARAALTHVADEIAARQALREGGFDLLIVDRNLDPGDGLALLGESRARGDRTPAILLTTMSDPADIVSGLAHGDDYVTKPFDPAVLRARVDAVMRRADADGVLRFGRLEINFAANHARIDGRMLAIEQRPLNVLALLALRHPGKVTMGEMLIDLWRYNIVRWPDGVERVFHPGILIDKNISAVRAALAGAGIEDALTTHPSVLPEAEFAALETIDKEEAKRARSLTRGWSLHVPALYAPG
jgi:two-component system OmpR family response regulator